MLYSFSNKYLKKEERINLCLILMLLGLEVISVTLILIGLNTNGTIQNLFLGLGTGATTSFLVSLFFCITSNLKKLKEKNQNHSYFMNDLRVFYYRFITSIDFDKKSYWRVFFKRLH